MGKISLINIAEELAAKSGLGKDVTDNFLHAFIETIEKGLNEDNLVKVKGLGTFKLLEVSDRGSIDVNTGERITIKGHTKVSFTPDSAMKEFVNRPFAHFEPTELNEGYSEEELPETPTEQTNEDNEADAELVGPEKQAAELQETDEEVVSVTIDDSPADSPFIDIHEGEDIVETPASEDSTEHAEEPIESVAANTVTEDNMVAEADETVVPVTQKKRSRWYLAVLFVVLAGVVYYYMSTDPFVASSKSGVGEYMNSVNINLEQEIEVDKCTTESITSIVDTITTDTIKEEEVPSLANVVADNQLVEEQAMQTTPVVSSVLEEANSLVITELLATKSLKDITQADTTDFIIDGTKCVHTLQSGETIIQLARKYYGDKRLWPYIVKYNDIADFNKVSVDMNINIPVLKNRVAE